MVISHNLQAMNVDRQLGIVSGSKAKSTEKLSSGYKINRAADNSAGLSISEKMRKQIRGLNRASQNVEDGISYVQVADGALNEVQDMLQRINELSVKAANGTNSPTDREYIDNEVQQLKTEMERIFVTTSFNEKKIWDGEREAVRHVVGKNLIQSTRPTSPGPITYINNKNYDKIACDSYIINADDAGISLSWTGYNGRNYETDSVDWDTFRNNGNKFQIGDYFKSTDTDLFDGGNPVFDFTVSFSVAGGSTNDDIITAINNTYISAYESSSMSGQFEDTNTNRSMSVSASINYAAAYASRAKAANGNQYDFEAGADNFIKPSNTSCNLLSPIPNTSSLTSAKNCSDKWQFSFDMDGIGTVKATSNSITYWAPSDVEADDEGYWWDWSYYSNGTKYKSYNSYSTGGTLKDLMGTLTGRKTPGPPKSPGGLLTYGKGGDCDNGGYIQINFSLNSDNSFTYGNGNSSNNVGSMTLTLNVNSSDNEQSVLNKVKNTLNNNTVLDMQTNNGNNSYYDVSHYNYHTSNIVINDYTLDFEYNDIDLSIHSGANVTDKIPISYECLRLETLGISDTNVLTEENALKAIDEVADALTVVSRQRAMFGAYQNRLEHSVKINDNVAENTQAAESTIRDTDMAEEMVKFSNDNILQQAGESMLVQANQSNQGVISLLK